MIPKIIKGYNSSSIYGVLHYHESKVREGAAEKSFQSFPAVSLSDIHIQMVDHMTTHNPRVQKHQFHQIVISFDPLDKLDLRQKNDVIDEYLQSMGYDDHLYVSYHHMDKNHDHWHVIATASNMDGKLKSTRNDYHQSTRVARQLEKKYGLRILNKDSTQQNQRKKFLDVENHRFINAYRKLIDQTQPDIIQYPELLQNSLTNNQFRYYFKKQGLEDEYRKLITDLYKSGHLQKTKKQQLVDKVLELRNESRSFQEFITHLNNNTEFYGRFVKNEEAITYGYKDMYVKEAHLDQRLTTPNLKKYFDPQVKEKFSFDQVKKFVKNRIIMATSKSLSWSELEMALNNQDIALTINRRTNSTSLSFHHKGFDIKSSALGLSYDKIDELLQAQRKNLPVITEKHNKPNSKSISKTVSRASQKIASRSADQANYEREMDEKNSLNDLDI